MARSHRTEPPRRTVVIRDLLASAVAAVVFVVGLTGAADAAGAVVDITDYGFAPSPVTITVGQTVTWVNKGAVPHWVEPGTGTYGGGFIASPKIPPGGKYTATFSTVGTYTYHDAFYPFMSGTIDVKPAPAPTAKPTAKPTARATPKLTAKPAATARPTAKLTAKPAASARPTVAPSAAASATTEAAAPGSPDRSEPPTAGGTTTGPDGSTGPGSTTPGGSSDGGGAFGTSLLLIVLVGLAFVGGIWFSTSRRGSAPKPLAAGSGSAAALADAAAKRPPPPISQRPAASPDEFDEDSPIQATRTVDLDEDDS